MRLFSGLKNKYFDGFLDATGTIFISNFLVNVFNLVFWLFMVRRLSTEDYGILNSLFSLFMIISLPVGSLQTVITKFVSQFYSQGDFPKIRFFLFYLGKRILIFMGALVILFIFFSPKVAYFLNIPFVSLIIITAVGLLVSTINLVPFAALQGFQNFLEMAINSFTVGALKLILGILLVAAGFRVMGAMAGFVLSSFIGLVLVLFQMPKDLYRYQKDSAVTIESIKINSVYSYFFPVAISFICFMVLTNIDIILVKHYFLPLEAGYYSVAQMVGKVILFLPGAVSIVMFPKVVDSHSQNKETVTILKKSLAIVGILCFGGALISCLFPELILNILTGKANLQILPLVRVFALAMTFFALVQILMYYHLSIHSFKFATIMVFAALLQIILIALFHKNLIDIIYISLFCGALLFLFGMRSINFTVDKR